MINSNNITIDHTNLSGDLSSFINNSESVTLSQIHPYSDVSEYKVAVAKAKEYLDNKVYARVVCEKSSIDNDSLLPVPVVLIKQAGKVLVQSYSNRYPTVESRPVLGGNHQVGDLVYNTDVSNNKCLGWICIEEGIPGTWKEVGQARSWYNEIETLDYLPQPSELQLGRQILLNENNNSSLWICKLVGNSYIWTQQDYQVGTTADRPINPSEGYIRYNTDINSLEWWTKATGWESLISTAIIGGLVDEAMEEHKLEVDESLSNLSNELQEVGSQLEHIENKTDWINPDEFYGNDFDKLQTAINLAQETKKTIKLNRIYNITGYGSLNITKPELFDNIPLRIEGNSNGGIRKNDNGYIFSNGETSGRQFLFMFKNLNFYGVSGSGMKVIQGDKLSGLYIDSCLFHGVDSAICSESGFLQTVRFTNNIIAGGGKNNNFIIDFILGFDVTISNNQFEQCGNAIRQKGLEPTSDNKNPEGRGCNSLRIDSNVIEGCSGKAIEIGCCSGVTISNNYFEGNSVNIDVSKNISLSLLLFSNRFDFTNRPNTCGVIFPNKARYSSINDDKIVCISNLFTAGDSTNVAYVFNEEPDDNIKVISIGENISNTNYPNNIVMYNPSIKNGEINGYIPATFNQKNAIFVEKGATVVRTLNIPSKYEPTHSTITAIVSASKQGQWTDENFYIDENLARVSILNICISEKGKAKVVLKNNDTDSHADGRIILNIMKRF